MSDFVEQLRLAEKAAEDIYFAKVDRELIESLHKRMQAEKNSFQPADPAPKHIEAAVSAVPPRPEGLSAGAVRPADPDEKKLQG